MPIFLPIDKLWTDMSYFNSCTWTDHVSHDCFFESLNITGVSYTPTYISNETVFPQSTFCSQPLISERSPIRIYIEQPPLPGCLEPTMTQASFSYITEIMSRFFEVYLSKTQCLTVCVLGISAMRSTQVVITSLISAAPCKSESK